MTALRRFDMPMMTADEFLEWKGGVPGVVYELVDGVVRAQDAASTGHGGIHTNLIRLIDTHLLAHHPRCRVVTAPGIRPHIAAIGTIAFPNWRSPARSTKRVSVISTS